jgi:hypothetical protein
MLLQPPPPSDNVQRFSFGGAREGVSPQLLQSRLIVPAATATHSRLELLNNVRPPSRFLGAVPHNGSPAGAGDCRSAPRISPGTAAGCDRHPAPALASGAGARLRIVAPGEQSAGPAPDRVITASFKSLAGRNAIFLLAPTATDSPIAGLGAVHAGRRRMPTFSNGRQLADAARERRPGEARCRIA